MRMLRRLAMLVGVMATANVALAQRAGTIEAGVFGHFTKLDEDVLLGSSSFGAGGRLGFFAIRHLSLEGEYSFGTIEDNVRDVSMWYPFRGLVIGHIPITSKVKLLLGAGYKYDTWKGDTTKNQYEDGFTAIGGLRICINDGWSVRPEVVFDRNPSPNFQRPTTSTSTHLGFRFGISKFFGRANNTCISPTGAVPMAPPPPPVAPPMQVPPPVVMAPAPTANLTASPSSITAGSSAMLIWSSTNATRCSAPWTSLTTSAGSQSVSPTSTTTYTLTCTGTGGSVNAPVTVSVTAAPAAPPPPAAPPREIYRLDGVFFDFDMSVIKPEGRVKLDSAVTILNRFADMRVEIQGHTDSIATEAYNQALSLRRATAVRDYLMARGIAESRLTMRGFGETQPQADNGTDAGRALNRRVVLIEVR